MIYLDHAATTPMRPAAQEAMEPFHSARFGNPSGVHEISRRAKNAMEEARERAAEFLGASHPLEIVFTGGGTEADNLAIAGAVLAADSTGKRDRGVVTVSTEHEAVLESARFVARLGYPATIVTVDRQGVVSSDAIAAELHRNPAVVSVMAANNETGTVQPVRDVAAIVGDLAVVHTDAVQAFVSEDITVEGTGAHLISIAAHKFGGPQGVGLLYVRNGIELEPVLHGGGQELGRRSGTHNVAGIVGMVAAMEAAVADRTDFRRRVGEMRDAFEAVLSNEIPDLEVHGAARRLVQHSHLRIPNVAAETLLIRLDQDGVAAAAGSACHSGAIEMSHVLAAMGMDEEEAGESVRFTFGWNSTMDETLDAARTVSKLVAELR